MYALSSSNDDDDGRYRRVADYAEFCKFVEPLAYSIEVPAPSALDCVICSTEKASAQIGVRRCQVARYPCGGHACNCKEFPVCWTCLVQLLWQKSNSVLKQNGRYRAMCPFCSAEFCHLDLVRHATKQHKATGKASRKR